MPATAAQVPDEIVEALCSVNIFQKNAGDLKKRNDDVWKEAIKILEGKIILETLNLYARINCHKILDQVKERCVIAVSSKLSVNTTLDSTVNSSIK